MSEEIEQIHQPVLQKETIALLNPQPGERFLDGTLGLGGHASALFERCPDIELCALDRDREALDLAKIRLKRWHDRIHFFHLPFSSFHQALENLGWLHVNGAMLDLGVSSLQLDLGERGFSFRTAGPLDMRMNRAEPGKTAREIVNRSSFEELKNILAVLGEEPQAARIARKILEARDREEIGDTLALAKIIYSAYPPKWRNSAKNHPATRAFQAIRMAVNGEVEELKFFLEHILPVLSIGGRLAIISFHSIEDRLVKHAMRAWSKESGSECGEQDLCGPRAALLMKKPLIPTPEEMTLNPRARSAKLRACEKLRG